MKIKRHKKLKNQKKKKRRNKNRNQERLSNIARAGNFDDPEKLKKFLEEDRRITHQKKKKYFNKAKNNKKKVGSKMNSIHLKFFKTGADKRGILPKVHDNRISMLRENERRRIDKSTRKLNELRNNLKSETYANNTDFTEGNQRYLSKYMLI